MAKPSIEVINALQQTASNIEKSTFYQWGHMGSCNCGFLAQEITKLNKDDIHRSAMDRYGDWNEQLKDYCPTSGLAMDDVISTILNHGFDIDDLKQLERLSNNKILMALPPDERNLQRNKKADVVKYLRKWAEILETELLNSINITDIVNASAEKTLSRNL